MAFEGPMIMIPGLIAGADLSAASNQFKFVKLSANKTVVVCTAVTDKPIGVLQNTPTSGQAATVCGLGVTKVQGDADLGYGDEIGTSNDGQAAAYVAGTDTTKYPCGTVILDNSAAAGLITAVINCMSHHRGA